MQEQLVVFSFALLWARWIIMLQYSTVANHSDTVQQSLAVAFKTAKAENCCPIERATSCTVMLCCEAEIWQKGTRTQGENVSATGPGHMVLLDGLVECGLAQQQEAEANPHGQQPGHGKAESAGRYTAGEKQQGNTDRVVLQHVSIHKHTHWVCFKVPIKRN